MTPADLDEGERLMAKATPGPWDRFILDKPLSDIGRYVAGCILASGGKDFYFVSGKMPNGIDGADICHVGNGPTSEQNAALIVWLRNNATALLAELRAARECVVAADVMREHMIRLKPGCHCGACVKARTYDRCRAAMSAPTEREGE